MPIATATTAPRVQPVNHRHFHRNHFMAVRFLNRMDRMMQEARDWPVHPRSGRWPVRHAWRVLHLIHWHTDERYWPRGDSVYTDLAREMISIVSRAIVDDHMAQPMLARWQQRRDHFEEEIDRLKQLHDTLWPSRR